MYVGLREKLTGNKNFKKGKLIDIIGEDALMGEVGKLRGKEENVFVYGGYSGQKINKSTYEQCNFDFGGAFVCNGVIYFE